jgi:hypothetical protein
MRRSTLVLCLVIVMATPPGLARACTCVSSDAATLFRRARTVVVGRVIDTRPQSAEVSGIGVTRIAVDEAIRGAVGAELVVRHALDGNVCGVRFEPGERTTILAGAVRDGEVSTGACAMARSDEVAAVVRSYRARLALADQRVAQQPADIGARLARAGLLAEWGDVDLALVAYSDIVQRWPQDARGWLAQGTLLLQQNRAAEAVPVLERAAALDPRNAGAQRLLRQARQRAGTPSG